MARRSTKLCIALLLTLSACREDLPTVTGPSSLPSVSPAASPTPSPSPTAIPELTSPQHTAMKLAEAERKIRSPDTPAAELAVWGRVQQSAYRKLVFTPGWQAPALQALPEELRGIASLHIEAGVELSKLSKPVEKVPDWRIVAPPPADELLSHYKEAEAAFNIRWQYLAAIHLVESRMGRIRGVSSAGAQGPMQFLPSTWARYGEGDIENPRDAILAAGRYLKAAGAPANMARALYAYNHSDRYVRAVAIYAEQMLADPKTYHGYYHWQVYVRTTSGDVLLEVGYPAGG